MAANKLDRARRLLLRTVDLVSDDDAATNRESSILLGRCSLVPRPLPDFISQPWRKKLRDKIWEWPGDEAREGA